VDVEEFPYKRRKITGGRKLKETRRERTSAGQARIQPKTEGTYTVYCYLAPFPYSRTAASLAAERARGAIIPQKLQTKLPVAEMLTSEPNDPTDRPIVTVTSGTMAHVHIVLAAAPSL